MKSRPPFRWNLLGATWLVMALGNNANGLELVRTTPTSSVFGGGLRTLGVIISNASDRAVSTRVRVGLVQTSFATAVSLGETSGKRFEVLPRQTVVETAVVAFPEVRAETRFLVRWLAESNTVIGHSEVLVYPTNLLGRLKTLAGTPGVFDPLNQLKPALRAEGVAFLELAAEGWEAFTGRLVFCGPLAPVGLPPEVLAENLKALARRGVTVVWLQTFSGQDGPLQPSFFPLAVGTGTLVVARQEMVLPLADRPEAQMNLLRLAEAGLKSQPPVLPGGVKTNSE